MSADLDLFVVIIGNHVESTNAASAAEAAREVRDWLIGARVLVTHRHKGAVVFDAEELQPSSALRQWAALAEDDE